MKNVYKILAICCLLSLGSKFIYGQDRVIGTLQNYETVEKSIFITSCNCQYHIGNSGGEPVIIQTDPAGIINWQKKLDVGDATFSEIMPKHDDSGVFVVGNESSIPSNIFLYEFTHQGTLQFSFSDPLQFPGFPITYSNIRNVRLRKNGPNGYWLVLTATHSTILLDHLILYKLGTDGSPIFKRVFKTSIYEDFIVDDMAPDQNGNLMLIYHREAEKRTGFMRLDQNGDIASHEVFDEVFPVFNLKLVDMGRIGNNLFLVGSDDANSPDEGRGVIIRFNLNTNTITYARKFDKYGTGIDGIALVSPTLFVTYQNKPDEPSIINTHKYDGNVLKTYMLEGPEGFLSISDIRKIPGSSNINTGILISGQLLNNDTQDLDMFIAKATFSKIDASCSNRQVDSWNNLPWTILFSNQTESQDENISYQMLVPNHPNYPSNLLADYACDFSRLANESVMEGSLYQEKIQGANFSCFPNPAINSIQIGQEGIDQLTIYNASGQVEKFVQRKKESALVKVDVSNLNSGIYFIIGLNQSGNVFSSKFVKK